MSTPPNVEIADTFPPVARYIVADPPADHVRMPIYGADGEDIVPASVDPILARVDMLMDAAGHRSAAIESGSWDLYIDLLGRLYDLVLAGYAAGVQDAPAQLLSGSAVAELLGLNGSRVRLLAAQLGVGSKLAVGSQDVWVFTPADVDTLRNRNDRRGRPKAADNVV